MSTDSGDAKATLSSGSNVPNDSASAPDDVTSRYRVWREYDDGYKVRSMTVEDARIVQGWYLTMGIISRFDLETLLSVHAPAAPGLYIGEWKGEVVASAIRVPWGENIMYGSYYFVAQPYRRLGFGTRLRDEVAREFVGERILCVDAVHGRVTEDNISKFQYQFAFDTRRFLGVARESYDQLASSTAVNLVSVDQIDMSLLLHYDDEHFVSSGYKIRHNFLRLWTHLPDGATYIALDNDTGNVIGYGCRRKCIPVGHHQVGPLYADSPTIAEMLLARLCSDVVEQNVTITMCVLNKSALEIAKKFGFEEVFTVHRMHLNGDPHEYRDTTYVLTSIDICGF